ncbi:MAG: PaaI family thioesterase [Oscillospiraceae bacterium]
MDSCADQKKQKLYREMIDRMNEPGQFSADIHVRIDKIDVGYAEGVLDVHPENLNLLGIVHGGCLATLADTVAGMGVAATGHACVTVNYGMNFLRPATGKQIRCVATAEKMGKTLCVMRTDLLNETGQKVASGNFTFCVMEPLDPEHPFGRSKVNAE